MPLDPRQQQQLFEQALARPVEERAAFLDEACGQNADLRARVDRLLDALAHADNFLAEPTPTATGSNEHPGGIIDRYKLLQQIGEGGFGSVWMAEQQEPVRRKVALKVIKLGMDTKQVTARFEAERQALAMMDHPNIAKVHDGGTTPGGRPYFVMELVHGASITDYCDQAELDTTERLQLLQQVCYAVQHAHQKGVIHRDLKPSNILVTLHDGKPVPKVIDFGIAKATSAELTQKTLFTEFRQMVGTPEYMAPEQAELSGLDVDTRADVYSLGVLLYELLTGTKPFDLRALLDKGYGEMLRVIREDEPPKPSTRVSTLGDQLLAVAKHRRALPALLGRSLRGDLDWIVMKALEKDRSRRYATANDFAADIGRHLQDEPVSAGAPSASYRLRKFVRRNRAMVFAGGAVALTLVIGMVAFAWQAGVARDQRDRALRAQTAEAEQRAAAEASALEARNQADIAEAVAEFQTDMLQAADPNNPRRDQVTVLQTMMAAEKKLDEGSLEDQPLVAAGVRQAIGSTRLELGQFEAAESDLRQSLKLLQETLGAENPRIRTVLNLLAMALNAQNKRAEAERFLRDALSITKATRPIGHHEIGTTTNNLALVLHSQRKFADAEPLYREALKIARAAVQVEPTEIAAALNNLASVLVAQGKLEAAEAYYREALQIFGEVLPAGHPDIGTTLCNLASLLHRRGELVEAEALFRRGLEIHTTALPIGHEKLGNTKYSFGRCLLSLNKDAEAAPLLRDGLQILRASLSAGHPKLVKMEDSYFDWQVTTACKAIDPAKPASIANVVDQLQQCLAEQRDRLANNRPALAGRLATCGKALLELHAWAEAEPLLRECLAIREQDQPDDWSTFNCKSMLGETLLEQSQMADAKKLLLEGYRGVEKRRASLPAGAEIRIGEALERLVRLFEAIGDEVGAASWRKKLEAERAESATQAASAGK